MAGTRLASESHQDMSDGRTLLSCKKLVSSSTQKGSSGQWDRPVSKKQQHSTLMRNIVSSCARVKSEFAHSKHLTQVLQDEKNLLTWHLASNDRDTRALECSVKTIEQSNLVEKRRLLKIKNNREMLEKEHATLFRVYEKTVNEHDSLKQKNVLAREQYARAFSLMRK